ncbi:ionotropic receptor 21a-like isoform X1 [Lepeophtheirus salmonis]|uniref:ionotropic receptor 21a-like isoform X1 n=2 Tax=Lepeophtheirus salmonis TaxID=72036 RepID=UPI001AE19BEB|nr:glutamate receptor ionotropic, delta-1-like [Lepeophtheirus salmonis]
MILCKIFLLASLMFCLVKAQNTKTSSKNALIKYIFKELETKENANCVLTIVDEELENDFSLFRETILPLNIYISNDLDKSSLRRSSSYCKHNILFFRNLQGIKKLGMNYGVTLRQKGSIYVFVIQDMTDIDSIGKEYLDVIKTTFFLKVKKITLVGALNDSSKNEKFWVLTQNFRKKGKGYETNIWNGRSMVIPVKNLFEDKLRSFLGRTLKTSSFLFQPYITAKKVDENGVITEYGGIETQILKQLSLSLDFKYNSIIPPTDGLKWGSELSDGSFTGLIGDVMFERTDIAFAQFFITPSRMDRIDFTQPYDIDKVCFMVIKPPPLAQWKSLAYPLTISVWLGVFLSILVSLGFIYIYTTVTNSYEKSFSFVSGVFFYLGTLFDISQPMTSTLSKLSIRLAYTTFLLAIFVVTIGYRGSLISVLSVPHQSPPINSVKEVAESPLPIASLGPLYYETFMTSQDEDTQKIVNKFIVHYDYRESFKNLSDRKVIMCESQSFLDYSMRERFTDNYGVTTVHLVQECLNSFRIAFATSKNSIYTDRIGDKIIQLNAGGLIEKWIEDELNLIARLSKVEAKASHKKLTINDLEGPFYLWLFGIGISMTTFVYEVMWNS